MILPRFTISTENPSFSPGQALFFSLLTVLFYTVFLAIRTVRHRGFFQQPPPAENADIAVDEADEHGHGPVRPLPYHTVMLLVTLVPIVLLSKRLAGIVDFGIVQVGAPISLGGVIIAALVFLMLVFNPQGIQARAFAKDG